MWVLTEGSDSFSLLYKKRNRIYGDTYRLSAKHLKSGDGPDSLKRYDP